ERVHHRRRGRRTLYARPPAGPLPCDGDVGARVACVDRDHEHGRRLDRARADPRRIGVGLRAAQEQIREGLSGRRLSALTAEQVVLQYDLRKSGLEKSYYSTTCKVFENQKILAAARADPRRIGVGLRAAQEQIREGLSGRRLSALTAEQVVLQYDLRKSDLEKSYYSTTCRVFEDQKIPAAAAAAAQMRPINSTPF